MGPLNISILLSTHSLSFQVFCVCSLNTHTHTHTHMPHFLSICSLPLLPQAYFSCNSFPVKFPSNLRPVLITFIQTGASNFSFSTLLFSLPTLTITWNCIYFSTVYCLFPAPEGLGAFRLCSLLKPARWAKQEPTISETAAVDCLCLPWPFYTALGRPFRVPHFKPPCCLGSEILKCSRITGEFVKDAFSQAVTDRFCGLEQGCLDAGGPRSRLWETLPYSLGTWPTLNAGSNCPQNNISVPSLSYTTQWKFSIGEEAIHSKQSSVEKRIQVLFG